MTNDLRKQAEAKLALSPPPPASTSPAETQRLVHELRVHQIELEMQNEELRRAYAEIEASRARYFDLYDLAPVGYVTVSEKGLLLEANLTAATLLNVARGALVKQPWTRFILKEDQDIYYLHRKKLFEAGAPQTCELRLLKSDGAVFWARLNAAIAEGPDAAPACRVVLSDITDRRQAEAEREQLDAKLRQAQKMESVGRLAGGVAHDFNNMMGIILGYTEMAKNKTDEGDPLYDDLKEISIAANRSAELTRQLLAFARKQTIVPRPLDLNETVEDMLRMLRRLIGEDIDLSWEPGSGLWPVNMDPAQVDQVLANLLANARDAISGVGKVTIETDNTVLDETDCADRPDFVPGEFVVLAVSDNGRGMDKTTMNNLFEPFFTTKSVGEGTGLGLATVYGIVRQNNGFINVYSEPGQGATFKIYLPRHAGETDAIAAPDTTELPVGNGETVLVVEDEAAILKLARKMLTGLGYNVLTEPTPSAALKRAGEHRDDIDLLVTDVIMPEMNGRDLAERLHVFYPGLKVLHMSGYTADVIARRGLLDQGVQFIQKPFNKRDLARKVREALLD